MHCLTGEEGEGGQFCCLDGPVCYRKEELFRQFFFSIQYDTCSGKFYDLIGISFNNYSIVWKLIFLSQLKEILSVPYTRRTIVLAMIFWFKVDYSYDGILCYLIFRLLVETRPVC